ncbi:hypothetical protein TIFTF001_002789 [Ficus carica]|uniref:NAD(P)-binding domain-containing protein n=1 Tax=Ficus carica TaxID=3494 RepID=A0AA88CUM3_FICCA|nr:hypothetical protein TIFTF001_002789 [Ficus carica]
MASFVAVPAIQTPPSSLPKASPFPARLSCLLQNRPALLSLSQTRRSGVRCSYAEASTKEDSYSAPIDVVADVRSERIVVLGGSGFVGTAICKAAVSKGIEVVSNSKKLINELVFNLPLSKARIPRTTGLRIKNESGRPTYPGSWVDQVPLSCEVGDGDVFYLNWDEVLPGATAVVSTIGGFGSEEQMQRINGEANVVAVNIAKDYGIPKFILISVHDYNLPSFLLSSGYFTGKRKAESEVLSKYPNSGVVLRPGFIYGKRRVEGFEIPLDVIGEPLERILRATENFTKPLSSLPASDLLLAPPVSVDDVALAVINAITDDDFFGIFTIEQIKEAAEKVKGYHSRCSRSGASVFGQKNSRSSFSFCCGVPGVEGKFRIFLSGNVRVAWIESDAANVVRTVSEQNFDGADGVLIQDIVNFMLDGGGGSHLSRGK